MSPTSAASKKEESENLIHCHETGLFAGINYVKGRVSAELTASRLGNMGVKAATMMGEFFLVRAFEEPALATELLDKAELQFASRLAMKDLLYDGRAAMRQAQMPILHAILGATQFPNATTVLEAYTASIAAAAAIVSPDSYHLESLTPYCHRRIRGDMSEASVLLLTQRYALKNGFSDVWLPMHALLSSDVGRNPKIGSTSSTGWDIEIYTPGEDDTPEPTYKLQVKAGRSPKVYPAEITVVQVDPVLSSYRGECLPAASIIRECKFENDFPDRAGRISGVLDERTEQLLELIG